MSASHSFIFALTWLHKSSSKTHLFSPLALQLLHAMQLRTWCVPNDMISDAIPCCSRLLASSLKAIKVFPDLRGLPLINCTFIFLLLFFFSFFSVIEDIGRRKGQEGQGVADGRRNGYYADWILFFFVKRAAYGRAFSWTYAGCRPAVRCVRTGRQIRRSGAERDR